MNSNEAHPPAKPVFSPPKAYIQLLRKAVEAGYTPTEAQKRWLNDYEEPREKNYESNVS